MMEANDCCVPGWIILGCLLILSLLLSAPSILRLPRMLPLLHADVRAAAPSALEELRKDGLWLVNVDLLGVERKPEDICFHWEHRYTSRMAIGAPEFLTTCVHARPS